MDTSQVTANDQLYTASFYDGYASRSRSSALKVLSNVFDYITPNSIIDVGCGIGTWLSAAEELGCSQLYGVDGEWVCKNDLLSQDIQFNPIDFESEFSLPGTFDLCMTLEVAEHISEGQADRFVDQLCGLSEVVLFSAAIPGQGGAHHVNEQPQSYWIKKFQDRDFDCFDVIRQKVWDDDQVEFWYRQNAFLFVRSGSDAVDLDRLREESADGLIDVVHPGFFQWKQNEYRGDDFRSVLRHLKSFTRAKRRSLAAAWGATSSPSM